MPGIQLNDGKTPVLLRYVSGNWELCWKRNRSVTEKDSDGNKVKTVDVEEYWSPEKWYSNPVAALSALLNMKVGHSEAKSLGELISSIESIRNELLAAYDTQIKGEN